MIEELEQLAEKISNCAVKNFKFLNKEQREKFDEIIKLIWEIIDLTEEGD